MSLGRMVAIVGLTGDNFGEIWSIGGVWGSPLRPSSRLPITPAIPHVQGGFAGRVAPGPSGPHLRQYPRVRLTGEGDVSVWHCQIFPCASCWSQVLISAIARSGGIRRWRLTSTARA